QALRRVPVFPAKTGKLSGGARSNHYLPGAWALDYGRQRHDRRRTTISLTIGESRMFSRIRLIALASFTVCGLAAAAGAFATNDAPAPDIPTCDKKIGTLAVTEPQNKWWVAYNLESPEALIKVYVSRSKCFTLVDRGKGL